MIAVPLHSASQAEPLVSNHYRALLLFGTLRSQRSGTHLGSLRRLEEILRGRP